MAAVTVGLSSPCNTACPNRVATIRGNPGITYIPLVYLVSSRTDKELLLTLRLLQALCALRALRLCLRSTSALLHGEPRRLV